MLTFVRLSEMQNLTYYVSLGTIHLAVPLHSISSFLVVIFTFEFGDRSNAGASNGNDRRVTRVIYDVGVWVADVMMKEKVKEENKLRWENRH